VVVGGTSGIGEGIALRLAKANVSVTVVGRSKERGEEVVKRMTSITASTPTSSPNERSGHQFIQCDSFLMKNIQATCEELHAKTHAASLNYLVLTQGMATTQGRTETQEGIDQKLALHYFGRMMFIRELLPALRQGSRGAALTNGVDSENDCQGRSKVLSIFSAGVHKPYVEYQQDFELKQAYSLTNAANSAGMYNDLGLDAWSQQSDNREIDFIHASPGFVNTEWGKEMPWYIKAAVRMIQPFGRSAADCAEVMCHPLFNPLPHSEVARGGFLLMDQDGNEAKKMTSIHHQPEIRDFVFTETMKVLDRTLAKK
jgi:NAD(P)-dependent dehydrogenase (short-subunit alcohol dehydrogenase family)